MRTRWLALALVGLAISAPGCAYDTEDTDDDDDAVESEESALSGGVSAYKVVRKGHPYDRPMNHNDTWVKLSPKVLASARAGKLALHDRNGAPLGRILATHAPGAKGDLKLQFNESVVFGRDRWFYVWGNATPGGSGWIPGNWLAREPQPSNARDFDNGGNPKGGDTVKHLVAKPVLDPLKFCRSWVTDPSKSTSVGYDDYGTKAAYRYADGTQYQPLLWNLPDVTGGGLVRTAIEDGAEVHLLDNIPERRVYHETCKSSTRVRDGERWYRVRVTGEDKSQWLEFRYAWVVPGKTRPGVKANERAYGWILTAHIERGARVDHLR